MVFTASVHYVHNISFQEYHVYKSELRIPVATALSAK